MQNRYLDKIKEQVLIILRDTEARVMLFGSRARKDNHDRSDVDIAVEPRGKFDNRKINVLKNKMEELNIPYKVEIVNLNEVSESFRKEILKDAVIWKD